MRQFISFSFSLRQMSVYLPISMFDSFSGTCVWKVLESNIYQNMNEKLVYSERWGKAMKGRKIELYLRKTI